MITYQKPNKELSVFLIAVIVGMFTSGLAENIASSAFYLAGSIWAYAEVTSGANWLRRGLGGVVLAYLLVTLILKLHR